MKTNKEDIRLLKSKHRLELVMQEAGESFEVDTAKPDHWHSKITPGLNVDIRLQVYELSRPGTDAEKGDVIAWLQRRYAWDFGKAIKFLQNRAPDPIQEAQPIKDKKTKQQQPQQNDYRYDLMDKDQQAALELVPGDWVIKYFNKSSQDMAHVMNEYPHRFRPVMDFGIEKCAQCETSFKWQDPQTVAYAQETQRWMIVTAENDDQTIEVSGQITADDVPVDELFIDDDFVICEKCRVKKYARYKALALVKRSARKRENAAAEEQRQFERERAREADRERDIMESKGYVFGGFGQILYEPPDAAELSP
jgi:hypothetical protein